MEVSFVVNIQNHINFVISNFSICFFCCIIENFLESIGGVHGAGRLGGIKITKYHKHGEINCKSVEEEVTDGLLYLMDTFGVKTWIFVGRNWMLNVGSV